MAPSQILLPSLLLSVSSLLHIATSTENCPVEYCDGGGGGGPRVKFPFQMINNLAIPNPRCGYPRFKLSCSLNQTILMLPHSGGPFTVLNINYNFQTLYIKDPRNCLPKRYLEGFSLLHSPFHLDLFTNVTFLNCSSSNSSSSTSAAAYFRRTVPCLSNENYTVLAVPVAATGFYDESLSQSSSCKVIRSVMVPFSRRRYWTGGLEDDILLKWSVPFCGICEGQGEACGFAMDSGLDTGCFDDDASRSGISRGAKYAVIIGIGVPGTLFIIGLGCYLCSKVGTADDHQRRRRRHRSNTTELSASITLPPPTTTNMVSGGLDRPTIESYPETLLGESRRLPKPNDNTCPICLSEYEPKETLRTIPECNHYFHADCIDKWLRMNASCPVCRNSPEGSSFVTTPSSTSTSSRSFSVVSP